jgi:metal-sulfur cluster biosynthetic enzyme
MKYFFLAAFCITFSLAQAQLPNVSLTNAVDGKNVSLEAYSSGAGVVIIFTSNVCPFDEHYRGRINKLAKEFGGKVPVLLINSHVEPTESIEAMTTKAQQAGISVPYLADKDQTLMMSLKATKSPQSFLLKNVNGKLSVVFSGAIDDNAQVENDVRTNYLRDAINAMLNSQPIQAQEVRPSGCSIKKK